MEATTSSQASQANWKINTQTKVDNTMTTTFIPFAQARQFFAVDASGSTRGDIIRLEAEFVTRLRADHAEDQALTWGSGCGEPTNDIDNFEWKADQGGTQPSTILKSKQAREVIDASDVWYLLTDGGIWGEDVEVLSRLAMETGTVNVPVIFLIIGRKQFAPSDLNVSVGISFFANAPDVLVLFKDLYEGHLYVLAGKGYFKKLVTDDDDVGGLPDLETWDTVRELDDETAFMELCRDKGIQIPSAQSRPKMMSGIVRLGSQWDQENNNAAIDLDLLFTSGAMVSHTDLDQLLAEEAFNNLSIICKTRGRIQDLRTFLVGQKVEEINVKLEDVSDASEIALQLADPDLQVHTREALQKQLREAHANNRRRYQEALKNMKESEEVQAVRNRNRTINHALEKLAELENSGYTAEILGRRSNRARRAGTVVQGSEVSISSLDLDTPKAFRGECPICYGDNELMSIVLKTGADRAANTDNFALDFPLAAGRFKSNRDLIASQHVCFQCALAFNGRTIFREEVAAILPTLDCAGGNKNYIQEQLYFALTGRLRTGASGTSQLFMTILDQTLKEKQWAGANGESLNDPEVVQRRAMLQWTLENMLQTTRCRETFNEQGEWVTYREALAWAAKEFRENGVDSWVVGYPIAGFMQLIRFGQQLDAFDEKTTRDMRLAKVLHSVASAYLAQLLKNIRQTDNTWRQPLLELVYARFNIPLIPIDTRDQDSLVNAIDIFWPRLATFLPSDNELLTGWAVHDQELALRRVQLLAIWLIYHQGEHTRAKTFFQTIRHTQTLAHLVLDVHSDRVLPASLTDPVLLYMFRRHHNPTTQPQTDEDSAFHARHTGAVPFAQPFGPSVLRCSYPACGQSFLSVDLVPAYDEVWTDRHRTAIRDARARHLIKVFGVDEEDFARKTTTGLPMVTQTPEPPCSAHSNLHIGVVRTWSRMGRDERRKVAIADDDGLVDEFVRRVVQEVCGCGRGDIFTSGLEEEVKQVLPSFLEVLWIGLKDGETDVAEYEHDWTQNTLEWKAKYEMRLMMNGGK